MFKNLKENIIVTREQNGKLSREMETKNSRSAKLQPLKCKVYQMELNSRQGNMKGRVRICEDRLIECIQSEKHKEKKKTEKS